MRLILLSLILGISLKVFSQPQTIQWRNPDYKDLQMRQCALEPSAPAMILEEYGNMYFSEWREELRLFYDIRRRIKVFSEKGKKFTHYETTYYAGYDHFEEIVLAKAWIYTIQNGRPVKKKLKRRYIQNINLGNGYYKLSIDFPELKPGDIVDYRVILATFWFQEPKPWYFQHQIPVRYSEFSATIPDFMQYYFHVSNPDLLQVNSVENGFTTIQWTGQITDQIPPGLDYRAANIRGTFNFRFDCKFYKFAMKNVLSFSPEQYLDNPKNYMYHVRPLLVGLNKNIGYYEQLAIYIWEQFSKRMYLTLEPGYKPMTRRQAQAEFYPAGYYIFRIQSWQQVAQQFRKDPDLGVGLKKFLPVSLNLKQLEQKYPSLPDRAIAIYNWVQQNIDWNGSYSAAPDPKLIKAVKNKQGNSAAVNMILVNLLNRAGIPAMPVLLRTVDKGHLITKVPAFYQFNHLIAAAQIDNKLFLLDATKNNPWFMLDSNDHNLYGLLVDKDTAFFVWLQNPLPLRRTYQINLQLQQNHLSGKIQHTLLGGLVKDSSLIGVRNNFQHAEAFKLDGQTANSTHLTENYSLVSDAQILSVNDSALIIKPFAYLKALRNIFSSYSRLYPVYLFNQRILDVNLTVELDKDYQVSMPQPVKMSLQGAELWLKPSIQGKTLKLSIHLALDKYYFTVEEFYELYKMFETLEKFRQIALVLRTN